MALSYALKDWDPRTKHVYTDANSSDRFFSSDDIALVSLGTAGASFADYVDTLISATGSGGAMEFIGLMNGFNFNSAQSITPVFEIGSSLAYYISAQSSLSFAASVVMWKGPSILSRVYHDYASKVPDADIRELGIPLQDLGEDTFRPNPSPSPGDKFFGIGFQSTVYSHPVGLLTIFKFNDALKSGNSVQKIYGAWYWEYANVAAVGGTISAGTTIMTEGINGFAESIYGIYLDYSETQTTSG